MKFVVPLNVVLAVRTQDGAERAKQSLLALLHGMVFRVAMLSKGVPYEGASAGDPVPFNGNFALPVWAFLECPTQAAAAQAKGLVDGFLREPTARDTIRANGVPFEAASIGEPQPYQPPAR